MTGSPGYRHHRHDDIVRLIQDGLSNKAVALELRVDRRAVVRIRAELGIQCPHPNATSRDAKVDRYAVTLDTGCVAWTGRLSTSGAPTIRHNGRELPAAHVAFERLYGRPPVGAVKVVCDLPRCLNPRHMGDELTRRSERMMERAVVGMPMRPWDVCPKGLHSWESDGRIEPNLTPYCKSCNTLRAARSRRSLAARIERTAAEIREEQESW